MNTHKVDVVIVGAGPVGLMCAYLGRLCGMHVAIVDKSEGPVQVGRADAANARTLQLYELVDLFDDLYPLGKACNTSSVWEDGKFLSRQSTWWEEIEGCFHKHFLMLGQAHLEQLLVTKLEDFGVAVKRCVAIEDIQLNDKGCLSIFTNGERIQSRYVIGADGSHSFVRKHFNIAFEIVKPQIIWAVVDGAIESDFKKVPDIIVFQAETSDVAWIPRERDIDRFYIRMDKKQFTLNEVVGRINRAIQPYTLRFKRIDWFSQFSVKEAVAENYFVHDRVFLAGDACHVHSVNGGQGLNTGLGDAFNLMCKLSMVINHGVSAKILQSYERERKAIAHGVINTSGTLVRSTKYSETGTHAQDYVKILEKRAGYITGMGVCYAGDGLNGSRLHDFEVATATGKSRIYSLLDYTKYTLIAFGDVKVNSALPDYVKLLRVHSDDAPYKDRTLLVRPDAYIAKELGSR